MKICIVGAGNVGQAIGLLLQRKGHQLVGVASRSLDSAERAASRLGTIATVQPVQVTRLAEVVFITTNDGAIAEVCADIAQAEGFKAGQTVVHMSGSQVAGILAPAKEKGASMLSIHPLQSCATVERAVRNLPGSVFSIEGDEEAWPVGERLVRDLGGEFFFISAQAKPLYHAAACVASNYLVSLLHLARRLMLASGMPEELAVAALLPLVRGTVENATHVGISAALTGPIARGDGGTLTNHLKSIREKAPDILGLYQRWGCYTVDVAREKGSFNEDKASELKEILRELP